MIPLSTLLLPLVISAAGGMETEVITVTPISRVGVLYEDMGDLLVYHNTWSIMTEINLMELDNQTQLAEYTEHLVYIMCPNDTRTHEACLTQKAHIHAIVENMKKRTQIVRELLPRSRTRRSVFDGVGSAFHYLFGTMDHNNEQEIYSRLSELENDKKALIELEKRQISVVKTTFDRIKKPITNLMDRQAQIARRLNDLQNDTDSVIDRQQRQEVLNLLLLQIIEIEHQQQSLLDLLIASKHNQIHPLLISPKTLIEIYSKSNPYCVDTQKCLAIIYQVAHTHSYLLNEKFVVRIDLPILSRPPFKYYQIYKYPIPYNQTHIIIAKIKYSHIAGNMNTGEFLLLTPEDIHHFQTISHNSKSKTYVGPLRVPIIRSVTTNECAIKLLYNPLNETVKCSSEIQQNNPNLIIKMNKPNTWLFSLSQSLDIHLSCREQFLTQRLTNQGIMSVNRPCEIQIGAKTLFFEAPDTYPLIYKQPPMFPPIGETIKDLKPASSREVPKQDTPTLLTANEAHQLIVDGERSLGDIQNKLDDIAKKTPTNAHLTLSASSISITGVLTMAILFYLLAKCVWPRLPKCPAMGRNRVPPQETPESDMGPEEIPLHDLQDKDLKPEPLRRVRTLPRPKTIQLV